MNDAIKIAAWQSGVSLPYKARLEYIESSGSQYIDTGVIAGVGDTNSVPRNIEITVAYDSATYGYNYVVMGAAGNINTTPHYDINVRNGNYTFWISGEWIGSTISVDSTLKTISLLDGQIYLNNGFIKTCPTYIGTVPYSIYLFALNVRNEAVRMTSSVRIGKFVAYGDDGQNIIQRLIPVLDNNNVACMYDEVTGAFFYNAGSGSFTAGPVVVGGGYNRKCVRRSHRRSLPPSARFWRAPLWKEVA